MCSSVYNRYIDIDNSVKKEVYITTSLIKTNKNGVVDVSKQSLSYNTNENKPLKYKITISTNHNCNKKLYKILGKVRLILENTDNNKINIQFFNEIIDLCNCVDTLENSEQIQSKVMSIIDEYESTDKDDLLEELSNLMEIVYER